MLVHENNFNYHQWCLKYPDWPDYSRTQKKKIKQKEKQMQSANIYSKSLNYVQIIDDIVPHKEEKNMYVQSSVPTDQQQREYLLSRLNNSYYKIDEKASIFFGLENDFPPKTKQDFVDRVAKGLFVVRENPEDYYSFSDALIWRDPAKKKDYESWKKFQKDVLIPAKNT